MKRVFYPKLALSGIRRNSRIYFPYILTGGVMVMMYYILSFLKQSSALEKMEGGSVIMMMLPLGCIVVAVFSLLLLFYANSFLIKQRYREFGLYSVLGMDKRNVSRVMFWDALFSGLASMAAGLIAGIALSKAAELMLMNMLEMDISFDLTIGISALVQTLLVYGVIYFLLLLSSLVRVRRAKPLELMRCSNIGEKRPKFSWIFAVLGVILLGVAYYLAVNIEEPLTALFSFFIAVLLVIIGTYMLFISGSVALCRLLQKNKKYYYKPEHFVSVSSMMFRMKRNGAGLASICILLTMVLVMISSTASLYFGEEDSLKKRYPAGVNIAVTSSVSDDISDKRIDTLKDIILPYCSEEADFSDYISCSVAGMFGENGIMINPANADDVLLSSYENLGYMYVVSLSDYNKMAGENKTLADDECLIYSSRISTRWETFEMEYGGSYKVKERLNEYRENEEALAMVMPSVYVIVNDTEKFLEPIKDMKTALGESFIIYEWDCYFDAASTEDEIRAANEINEILRGYFKENESLASANVKSRSDQRGRFLEMYGSLFFIGIMLSIVFLLAAVLIIYYKQLSEGYEDRKRFGIMQKVGMTKRDIRKSINSQTLTVFFAPLVMAGIHLAFAYPFVSKILLMFAFDNQVLNIAVNLLCFAAFGIFYGVIYKLTSVTYFAIVSNVSNE